jgi:hypothetical protein
MKPLQRISALVLVLYVTRFAAAEKIWFEIRSTNFTVISHVGEKRAIEIARRCEQLRAAFSTVMNRASTNDPAPLLIFALNSEREVGELTGTSDRSSRHAGLFLARADESFILIDASTDPWPRCLSRIHARIAQCEYFVECSNLVR